jgi:hypothetical protein
MFSILIKLLSDKKELIAILFLFLLCQETDAQVLQPNRFEIPLSANEKHFEIIPADDEGLYLQRRFLGSKNDQLQLIKLDTAFTEKWSGFLTIEKNYLLMGQKSFNGNLHLLLRYKDYSRNDFILLKVSGENGSYVQHVIKGYIPFAPTEFQITEQAALIGGYYNRVPLVLHFSFAGKRSKVLPGMFNESGELTQIKIYPEGNFDVLISALNFKKQRTLWIKNYNADGNLTRNFSLDVEDNKHLIFGRSLKTGDNSQIIAGVYGNRSAEFSRGIFVASTGPSGVQQTRYYSFGDFENFFKYMKAKREQRVKSRIERRKIKGKKIKFNYRFLVHELVPYKDQYILLGEAFYPKYSSVDRSYGGYFTPAGRFSNSIIQNGRIFEGYFYTHAVVMGFNSAGDVLWDNSFEINDVRTFTLDQYVKLEVQDDKIALLYLYDNKLRTKIIQNNEVLEGKTMDPIRTSSENDIVQKDNSDVNKLEYWYDNYLYAYGVQQIGNLKKNVPPRRVFYINKVQNIK